MKKGTHGTASGCREVEDWTFAHVRIILVVSYIVPIVKKAVTAAKILRGERQK